MIKFGVKLPNSQSEEIIQTKFNQSEERFHNFCKNWRENHNNKNVDTVRHFFVGYVDAPAGGRGGGGGADTS